MIAAFFAGIVLIAPGAVAWFDVLDILAAELPKENPGRISFQSPDFFPILPWSPQHGWKAPFEIKRPQGLESIAECNFTMAGFVRPEDLPLCEKLSLAAIVVPDSGLVMGREWRTLSDAEIESRIIRIVVKTKHSPAVMGYFITDEPGATAFPALAKAVAAVKKYAPGKLAYINLYPDYATLGAKDKSQLETASYAEYLERYVNEVNPQALSYDNYMIQYSMDMTDRGKLASYFHNLMEVRRVALQYHIPFWNIVASNQIRAFTTVPSPANLMLQAYTTLAAGGKGVSWYTYYSGGYGYAPVDQNDLRTTVWRWLADVNHQISVLGPYLNRLVSSGVYFSTPPPVNGLPVLPGKLVREAVSEAPLMVGEFADNNGKPWVMVVNLSLERSARVTLKTSAGTDSLEATSAETGLISGVNEKYGLWLTAGQGTLLRLRNKQ